MDGGHCKYFLCCIACIYINCVHNVQLYKCHILKNAEKLYFVKFFIPVSRNNISVITQLQEKMEYIVNVVAFLCTFDVHALQKLSKYYTLVKYRMLLGFFSDTAYCRNPCTEKWFKYDDDHVSEMKESDVRVSIYIPDLS